MACSRNRFLYKCLCCCLVACVFVIVATLYYENSATELGSGCRSPQRMPRHDVADVVSSRQAALYRTKSDFVDFSRPEENPYKDRKEWKTFAEALEKYKKFHSNKLHQLKSSVDGGDVRTLTWACSQKLCSGLGDQLFRIQYFFLLAMISDRLFTIRWDERMQQTVSYLIPNAIDWTYFNRSKGMSDDRPEPSCSRVFTGTSIWKLGWNKQEVSHFEEALFSSEKHITVTGQVELTVMNIGNATAEEQGVEITRGLERIGVRKILLQKGEDTVYTDHRPLWYTMMHKLGVDHFMEIPESSNGRMQPTNSWLYVSHIIFTYLFGFTQELMAKVKNYQESLQLYNVDYLVVHIRTGFLGTSDKEGWGPRYKSEGWKLFSSSQQWKCIIQHGVDVRDKTLGPDAAIYISTDSDLVKDLVEREFSDQRIKFGNLTLVHSQMIEAMDVDGHLATWLDFFMLAEAKRIVHSESSFSVNAAFVRPIPHSSHSWGLECDKGEYITQETVRLRVYSLWPIIPCGPHVIQVGIAWLSMRTCMETQIDIILAQKLNREEERQYMKDLIQETIPFQ